MALPVRVTTGPAPFSQTYTIENLSETHLALILTALKDVPADQRAWKLAADIRNALQDNHISLRFLSAPRTK